MALSPVRLSASTGGTVEPKEAAVAPEVQGLPPQSDATIPAKPLVDLSPRILALPLEANALPTSVVPTWQNPVVSSLSEELERSLIAQSPGRVALVAWQSYQHNRDWVILVHGKTGSGEELSPIADALTAAGKQVIFLLYDDKDQLLSATAGVAAQQLQGLRERMLVPTDAIDFVGHSMGGIVSRAILKDFAETATNFDFSRTRFVAIDSPWDGFFCEPSFFTPLVYWGMKIFHQLGAFEMRANSNLYAGLFDPPIGALKTLLLTVDSKESPARALERMTRTEQDAIAAFILSGAMPTPVRARNFARALATDIRFEAMSTEMRLQVGRSLTPRQALLRAYRSHMPTLHGEHTRVLTESAPLRHLLIRALER